MKLRPIEINQLINFVKRNKWQTETFLIGRNECKFFSFATKIWSQNPIEIRHGLGMLIVVGDA